MDRSKICITSLNYDNYKELSNITWENKKKYADKHGYSIFLKQESSMLKNKLVLGFEKIYYIMKMLEKSDFEWIFFVGCDTLIMNYTLKIEDHILSNASNNESFIVATDCNGINMDSFMVKNDEIGKKIFKECWEARAYYNDKWCYEQKWFWDNHSKYSESIKIVPQKTMNSYLSKKLYPNQTPFDGLGTSSEFEHGDFLLHFPGTDLKKRLKLVNHFIPSIIMK